MTFLHIYVNTVAVKRPSVYTNQNKRCPMQSAKLHMSTWIYSYVNVCIGKSIIVLEMHLLSHFSVKRRIESSENFY